MHDLCTTCLSKGRKLLTLEATGLSELFCHILNGVPMPNTKEECILICWECFAKMKNWHKFRNQAMKSYRLLLDHAQETPYPLISCTTLAIRHLKRITYPEYLKQESILSEHDIKTEVIIKIEDEEHCEPETFVNEISVEMPKMQKEKEERKLKRTSKGQKSKTAHKKKSLTDESHKNCISPVNYLDDCHNELDDCHDGLYDGDDTLTRHVKVSRIEKIEVDADKDEIFDEILPSPVLRSTLSAHPESTVIGHTDKVDNGDGVKKISMDSSINKRTRKKEKVPPKSKRKIKSNSPRKKRKSHESVKNLLVDDCHNVLDDSSYDKVTGTDDMQQHLDILMDDEKNVNKEVAAINNKDIYKQVFAKKNILSEKPKCNECGKEFSSKKTFRYHWNVLHKGQNRYPCPICGKVYQWKSNLGRHLRSHKARDSGELYCGLCDKRFASVATYKQHLRVSRRHVSESEFSFMCNECGKKFVSKTRLRDHIDWEHLKKIKFRCHLCHKPFKCHTSLYVHVQNVHSNKEKDLCHVCGKGYPNAAKLKYHIVAMHTNETPYECAHCRVSFGWYSSLYRHIREVHQKMKHQPKKSSKKSKKLEMLPALISHQQPMH